MNQRGFGLIIILLAIVIIALIAGSGVYFSRDGEETVLERGNDAIEQAKALEKTFEAYDQKIEQQLESPE